MRFNERRHPIRETSRLFLVSTSSPDCAFGGVEAAHTMDSAARRSRRRANEHPRVRCRVRVEAWQRASEELTDVLEAAVDVPADEVRVVALQFRRTRDRFCDDTIPKSRGETFDLPFDPLGHVLGRAVRDMTVSPKRF